MVTTVQASWAAVEPHSDELARLFYGLLFQRAPQTRNLFPINMQVQRSRLLRAVVHVVQMVDRPEDLAPFLAQLGRDHRKFDVVAEHYEALGAALLGAVEHFSGDAWTPAVARAWTDAYAIVSRHMRAAADAERGPRSWLGRVVSHRQVGWDLAIVTVQTTEPIPYHAGQYLSVETPQRPRLWRYLSPANPPRDDGMLEFHVRRVEGGWVSRAIVAHARPGDTWRIGPPLGSLHLSPTADRGLLLIAGGTGVAPIKALLTGLAEQGQTRRTQMFFGGRTRDDLYALPDLRALSYTHPWLDIVPVLEHDPDSAGAEPGTLADAVTHYGAWADHDVIVCGSPAMIRATVTRMLVAGTPLDRIRYDPFAMD
ncbi:FAD-binding oxidoreductase [Pseudonocardia bannensis]|uniref:nitric oxide dioxygenase n=1 Tax=Pseudonocardia bannensis TaxID=630973 RepID=A0A848DD74_9PSEU|nr:FAD-binding oxidoreductase [Pseudonocardia bannensis]NMH90554.1 flavohemoprotein [Pseudonocardia bannensis]